MRRKKGVGRRRGGAEDFPFINNRQFNFNESILSPYPSLLVFIPSVGILRYFDLKKERKKQEKNVLKNTHRRKNISKFKINIFQVSRVNKIHTTY